MRIAISRAMMPITNSNSTKVKPRAFRMGYNLQWAVLYKTCCLSPTKKSAIGEFLSPGSTSVTPARVEGFGEMRVAAAVDGGDVDGGDRGARTGDDADAAGV